MRDRIRRAGIKKMPLLKDESIDAPLLWPELWNNISVTMESGRKRRDIS